MRSRLAGLVLDPAVEQPHGREIARVFERLLQGYSSPRSRRRNFAASNISPPRRVTARQRDRRVPHDRTGSQALAECRQVGQRLDRRARLTHGLGGAIELAERIGESAGHGEYAAGPVLQHQGGALHHRPRAQLRPRRILSFAFDETDIDHVMELEPAFGLARRQRHHTPIGQADAQ